MFVKDVQLVSYYRVSYLRTIIFPSLIESLCLNGVWYQGFYSNYLLREGMSADPITCILNMAVVSFRKLHVSTFGFVISI